MYACGLFLRDSVYTKLGTLKISVFLWCQADFRTDLGCCIACALTFAFEFAASAWFQKRANRTSNKHTPISWFETGAAEKIIFGRRRFLGGAWRKLHICLTIRSFERSSYCIRLGSSSLQQGFHQLDGLEVVASGPLRNHGYSGLWIVACGLNCDREHCLAHARSHPTHKDNICGWLVVLSYQPMRWNTPKNRKTNPVYRIAVT